MTSNPQFPAYLVTFTEEVLHEKLHLLCSVPFFEYEWISMEMTAWLGVIEKMKQNILITYDEFIIANQFFLCANM